MKKIFTMLLLVFLFAICSGMSTSFANDGNLITFSASDYSHSNIVSASDGTKFWVNGNFSFSFYSENEGKALMTISMLGLEEGKKGLVFLNCTSEGEEITYENAPEIKNAVGEGAIKIDGFTDIDSVCADSFIDYEFYVDIKKGINTVFVPSNNITNDCQNYAYEVEDNLRCNSKVCYKSITFSKVDWNSFTIYAHQIPKDMLSYHTSGQVLTGYDENNHLTDRTARQDYDSMYTIVPFYVHKAGDYIVNVRYNTYTSASVGTKVPAAVYVDADISSLKNDEWIKFLNTQNYPAETRKETTDEHLKVITKDGTLGAIDLGYWMVALYGENTKTPPFYHLKSFKIDNLKQGEHTLLFYTARDVLDTTDAIVNKDVFFNSFEFERITDAYNEIEVSCIPVVNMYTDSVYKAVIPKTYSEAADKASLSQNAWANKLHIPVTVANNSKENKTGMVAIVFYKEERVVNVISKTFTLSPYQSYEQLLEASFKDINADTFKVFIWDKEAVKPYLTGNILLEE